MAKKVFGNFTPAVYAGVKGRLSAAPIVKQKAPAPRAASPTVASDIAGKPKVVKKKKGPPMVGVLSSMNGKGY
jgi:hypothetical protein